jgi:hypothetical protein
LGVPRPVPGNRLSTCLIHQIHCESNRVIDKGDCYVGSGQYQGK